VGTWQPCLERGKHLPCCIAGDVCLSKDTGFARCQPKDGDPPKMWADPKQVICSELPATRQLSFLHWHAPIACPCMRPDLVL
jgi:hypothetical protein